LQLILSFYLQDEFGIHDAKQLVRTSSIMLVSMAAMIVVMQVGVFQFFKIRPHVLLRALGPLFVIALLIIMLAPNTIVMAFGFAVLGLSFACANPGVNGSASLRVQPWEQGAAAGFLGAGTTLGAILGPLVGTQIYTQLGHKAPMIIGAVVMGLVSLYTLKIKAPERPKPPDAA
jgi:MFS family permease